MGFHTKFLESGQPSDYETNIDALVADGSVKAGIITGSLRKGGVGPAAFHAWDSKIPADLIAQI